MVSKKASAAEHIALVGTFVAGVFGFRLVSNVIRKRREEREARDFFSRTSSSGTKY